jgi:hypothetical protein
MQKLQLDLNKLSVEAFETSPGGERTSFGTVHANAATQRCTIRSDCTQPATVECPETHNDLCM